MITADQLQKLGLFADWLDPLNDVFDRFEINTPERMAAFIGQCAHESGNFKVLQENLNYKSDALMKLFSRSRISEDDCKKYGRRDDIKQRADQDGIANIIYGGDFGRKNLGNTVFGDGAKYKGRGLIQLTGKANYTQAGDSLGVDLLNSPELVAQPKYAALTAGWFWNRGKLNTFADSGDIEGLTKKINGGTIGLDDRKKHIAHALEVLGA
jgi:putative chitinase